MMNRKHRKKDEGVGVQLNTVITPFLDMSFQLLFFFVLSFKPAEAMEGKLDFSLPASGEARARRMEDVDPSKPSDSDLALPAQVTVLVKTLNDGIADHQGNISAIIIKTESGEQAVPNIETLEKILENKRKDGQLQNTDDIKIQAESKLKYACVIEVMDACIRGGFARVSFDAPPDFTAN
jgi:biopolymer transport protein ExbD